MQINRLFEMVYLLLNRKTISAKELADRFEVSTRTIYRDLDTLSAAGIPVYTSRGRGGGISLLDNFVLNKSTITEEEQNQILFSLKSMSAAGGLNTDILADKLGNLFKKQTLDWIEVDFTRWNMDKEDGHLFEQIKTGILGKKVLHFIYYNAYGENRLRTVWPLKLVFKARSWYLQGICQDSKAFRVFRITRIRDLEISDQEFEYEGNVPPMEVTDGESQPALTTFRILFSKKVAYRVFDEFYIENITWLEDGSLEVTVKMFDDWWMMGFILSFGDAVKVLKPVGYKERLLLKLDEIRAVYET